MNGRDAAALDRYITGNYGEDQFREAGVEPCPCGRGEGRHHPDCPEWDGHVDNYEGDPEDADAMGV